MKNNKRIMIGMFVLLGITLIIGLGNSLQVLGNNEYIITEQEFESLSDAVILQYMATQVNLTSIIASEDRFTFYYDLTVIEDIQNDSYWIHNKEYPFELSFSDIQFCLDRNTLQQCREQLLTGNTETSYNITGDGEFAHTKIIVPMNLRVANKGLEEYEKAIELRDSISNIEEMEVIF